MNDYGHDLLFGSFITPTNANPGRVLSLVQASERAGLDLVTFQDHPYQPGFLDTWTLLAYVAAQTERIRLATNVLNLPLRQPAVLARSAASLDLLSGGRLELGLGAGAFWDAIGAMGVPRLSPGESIEALSEAIDIIRGIWDPSAGQTLTFEGDHYQVRGAARGPAPTHDIAIWLGAYKPRILRLTGSKADGWLPSLAYIKSLKELGEGNAIIDEAAARAGREPDEVRRLINISGQFGRGGGQLFAGPPEEWAEQLAILTLEYGFSAYILGSDDAYTLERFGQEVAPAARELILSERASAARGDASERSPVRLTAPGRGGGMRRPSPANPVAPLAEGIAYDAIPDQLAGKVITPRDAGYDDVRSTYMSVGQPGLVIMAESADDVSAAVRFASTQDVPLSVRSGGHGITRASTNDGGIIIDLSQLDSIEILDPQARRFRVGPGATWGHIAETIGSRSWAMTSGNYGDVGVGGLATGAGIGWLARKHGLTIDHIRAVEMVLADGSQVRADAETNPDLFWAVRGAGASIGIVTAFEMEAIELGNIVFANLTFDASDTAGFLLRWSRYLSEAPRELTVFLNLYPGRRGEGPTAQAFAVYAGDDTDEAVAALEPLLEIGPMLDQQAVLAPYPAIVAPLDSRHVGQQSMKVRNGFLERMTPEAAEALAELVAQRAVVLVEVRSLGGAVSDVDLSATAFAHRTPEVFVSAGGVGLGDRLDEAWSIVHPHMTGLYAAYSSDTRPERVHEAYPGATYERLLEIKRRYDPTNLFNRGITVDPDPSSSELVASADEAAG